MKRKELKFSARVSWLERDGFITVPCRLVLPKTIRERPEMILYPEKDDWLRLRRVQTCQMEAECGQGPGSTAIRAEDVHLAGGIHESPGNGTLGESYRIAQPARLWVMRRLNRPQDTKITFGLTESLLLSPVEFRNEMPDGSISIKRGEKVSFDLDSNCSISFENEYMYDSTEDKRTVMWSELVAKSAIESLCGETRIQELLARLDELLLLVSLAEGRRCGCMVVRWHSAREYTQLYRLDRSLPPKQPDHTANDCLIDQIRGSHEFLPVAFAVLRESEQRYLLWEALAAMTWFERSTVDTEFLRVFSAFEALVLAFRRTRNLEFAVGDSEWRILKKDVQKYLKNHHLLKGNSKEKSARRKMLYDNLEILRRVSLRRVTEELIDHYHIALDDQWPLFDDKDGVSLSDIRNKLVHGEHFSISELFNIDEAVKSLRVITLRFLLTSLGWDYQRSRACWSDWKSKEWKEARKALSTRFVPNCAKRPAAD